MHHSTPNAILTKLSTREYSNGDASFSRQKSSRVSHLVSYGAPVGFHVCVYGPYLHAHIVTSKSPSKHQSCWCLSHTRGNHSHLVTWIKKITSWWSWIQYSMNMHLRHSPWAHTHTTRSRALMTWEGRSHSHESPSYKVHNHPYPRKYRYTYILYNAITQSRKVNQTFSTFKSMAQQGTRNVERTLPYPRNMAQARSMKSKKGYMEGEP